jgi:hypothetical protein
VSRGRVAAAVAIGREFACVWNFYSWSLVGWISRVWYFGNMMLGLFDKPFLREVAGIETITNSLPGKTRV